MIAIAALDWLMIGAYAATVLVIGWAAARRQTSSEEYFLAGRRVRWWAAGVSLIATSFSGVSLVAGTGFGFGEGRGLRWFQLQIGDLVGLAVVCIVFLPFFSGLGITTAYEYLERRFGVFARTAASGLFILQTVARASVLILVPAVTIRAILGWPIESAILATTVVAIAYSASGGMAAVVWTDLLQMAVVLFSVCYSLALVTSDVPGGLDAILDHAREGRRLEVVSLDADRGTVYNLTGALVPYAVLACSLFGTGQQAVQRFLSCKDLPSARRAGLAAWAIGSLALFLCLFLGVSLAAWADLAPDAASLGGGDEVFPAFVGTRLPAGVAGLMLAAVFAASMSSLDSAIHSTSTALLVDFVRRFARRRPTPRAELSWARAATAGFGVAATLGALHAASSPAGILETLVTWLGYFAGPLLGLFLLGMGSRRANERGVLIGVAVAFAGVAAAALLGGKRPLGFHPLWLAPASTLLTWGVGWLASLLWPPPGPDRLRGLTLGVGPGPAD